MEGKIYIIQNDINNKVYIGQTIRTLQERFNEHIYDAINKDGNTNKFHSALINIGIQHFRIALLEVVDIRDIDIKEIEYIAKYNSFHDGYNSTLGGGGTCRIEYNKNKIIDDYNCGKSIADIAREIGIVNTKVISSILKENNVNIRDSRKEVYAIRNDGTVIKYSAVVDAYYDIIHKLGRYSIKFTNFSYLINKSHKTRNTAYGHIWTFNSDNVDDILLNLTSNLTLKERKLRYCSLCGKEITSQSKTGMCNSCANVKARGKCPKPSREQLIADCLTMNKQQIANKYGRSKSTVCSWFNSYGI